MKLPNIPDPSAQPPPSGNIAGWKYENVKWTANAFAFSAEGLPEWLESNGYSPEPIPLSAQTGDITVTAFAHRDHSNASTFLVLVKLGNGIELVLCPGLPSLLGFCEEFRHVLDMHRDARSVSVTAPPSTEDVDEESKPSPKIKPKKAASDDTKL